MRPRVIVLLAALPPLLWAAAARTQSTDPDDGSRVRCATRLSMALLRQSPSAELLAAADPQTEIDALLADDAFVVNFARFVNSRLNVDPGEVPAEDATFFLARHVLREGRPWRELFDGPYQVEAFLNNNGQPRARVIDDPDGLGYFRSPTWMRRYAGNEEDGYRLAAAFRIQQNIIGLDVTAVTTAPDQDISAEGRKSPACAGCHYDPYFALDKVAKVLSRRVGEGDEMTFAPPEEGPQEILGGKLIGSDSELVAALLDSTDFTFRTCRLAFEFLYGRPENNCEAPVFDACVDAFAASGDVRDAIRTVAGDPGFCD